MNSVQIIIILAAVAAIGVFGYLRSDKNEYAEREVALDSTEAKEAEAIFKQLAQSTTILSNASVLKPAQRYSRCSYAAQLL